MRDRADSQRTIAQVIVVAGPPLAGKSTLAAALAARLGGLLVPMDHLREVLFPKGSHSLEERDACYRTMHWVAERVASRGIVVVLDATYGRLAQRLELSKMVTRAGLTATLLQCRVGPDEALRRFRGRQTSHPAIDLTPERVGALAAAYPYSAEGPILDAERQAELVVEEALGYIVLIPDEAAPET